MESIEEERVGEQYNISNHLPDNTSTALSQKGQLEAHTLVREDPQNSNTHKSYDINLSGEMSHPTTCLIGGKMIKIEPPDNVPDRMLEMKLMKQVDTKKKRKNKKTTNTNTTNKKFVCIVCQNSFAYG